MDELKPDAGVPAKSPEQSQNPQNAPADAEPLLFYNVMPKTKEQGMVAPKVAVVEQTPATPPKPKTPMSAKTKRLIIIISLCVVLAGAATWAAFHFFVDSYKSENILATPGTKAPGHASSTPITTTTEWQQKYFGGASCGDLSLCGDSADPDHDGLTNLEEFKLGSDPNNKDSDGDGLADGDEVKVFLSDPLDAHTGKNPKFTDADNIRGGYDIASGKLQTTAQTQNITNNMNRFGLHEPSLSTLGPTLLVNIYNFSGSTSTPSTTLPNLSILPATTTASSSLDMSPEAMQGRDAQRNEVIKNVELALVKYQQDHGNYPDGTFMSMIADVKIYFKVATNPVDPVNQNQYVYAYASEQNGTDFTLSFFSETIRSLIKKHAADAQADAKLAIATNNDDQRKNDLELIQSALLLYSQANAAGNQTYVFPTTAKYKTELVPKYLSSMPKDPVSGADYAYQVSQTFDTFTIKAVLDAPPTGSTGYMCNQENCDNY